MAFDGCPIAADNCLLYYMHDERKNPFSMTPQYFQNSFQKVLQAMKLLNHNYEKDLNDNMANILYFYSFSLRYIKHNLHQSIATLITTHLRP